MAQASLLACALLWQKLMDVLISADLRSDLPFLERRGLILSNPAKIIRLPRIPKREKIRTSTNSAPAVENLGRARGRRMLSWGEKDCVGRGLREVLFDFSPKNKDIHQL